MRNGTRGAVTARPIRQSARIIGDLPHDVAFTQESSGALHNDITYGEPFTHFGVFALQESDPDRLRLNAPATNYLHDRPFRAVEDGT
jgi:hypothetical protein